MDSYRHVIQSEKTPDLVEMTVLASVLHSFYNGIEAIFQLVSKEFGEDIETATHWHKELLSTMAQPAMNRGQ